MRENRKNGPEKTPYLDTFHTVLFPQKLPEKLGQVFINIFIAIIIVVINDVLPEYTFRKSYTIKGTEAATRDVL